MLTSFITNRQPKIIGQTSITKSGGYYYILWTSATTQSWLKAFTLRRNQTIEVLAVGAGGTAGGSAALITGSRPGGGAGALYYASTNMLKKQYINIQSPGITYLVSDPSGDYYAKAGADALVSYRQSNDSIINSVTVAGGGAGNYLVNISSSANGGCGGGAYPGGIPGISTVSSPLVGFAGGNSPNPFSGTNQTTNNSASAGGGGVTEAGGSITKSGTTFFGGNGGWGTEVYDAWCTATNIGYIRNGLRYIGAGGAGTTTNGTTRWGTSVTGGGSGSGASAINAAAYITGSGGGGEYTEGSQGFVIIRYAI